MPKLRQISGKECLKVLCNAFAFRIVRQRGSHVVLRKDGSDGSVGTVIPLHHELKLATLRSILKLAKISEIEFQNQL